MSWKSTYRSYFFSGIPLTVDLIDANPSSFGIPTPSIYIKEDGSIEPSNASIQRNGNIYSLTGNVTGYQIEVQCNNIILDGNGFTLKGKNNYDCPIISGYGVLRDRYGITVKNFIFTDFFYGFILGQLSNCIITSNTFLGIEINSAGINNTQITNNNFKDCGVWISGSNNIISGNKFLNFPNYGVEPRGCVFIFDGNNNVVLNNVFRDISTPVSEGSRAENTIIEDNISVTSPTPSSTLMPTPNVPELPLFVILPLFAVLLLIATIILRKKRIQDLLLDFWFSGQIWAKSFMFLQTIAWLVEG